MKKYNKFIIMLFTIFSLCLNTIVVYADNSDTEFMEIGEYVSCGDKYRALISNIPAFVPKVTSSLYNAVMIIVPLILIVLGTIDLLKGLMSQKDDEIKKGREAFVKRIIGASIVFVIVLIVKLFVSAMSTGNRDDANRIIGCIDCFVNNECKESDGPTNSSNSNSNSNSNKKSNSNLSWGSNSNSNSNRNYWGPPEMQSNKQN